MTLSRLVLAVSGVLSLRTAAAEPCAPRAKLDGDATAVASVAVELQRLGVSTGVAIDTPRCPTVEAAVELDRGGGIAVAVRDRSHRSEGRVVSDPALAAAWIDSWLHDDLEFVAPVDEPVSLAPGLMPSQAAAAHAPLLESLSIAASVGQIWTDDGSRWNAATLSGCKRSGAFCLGGRVGYATQEIFANATAAHRTDVSLLATASTTLQVGRMSIAPELGVGVGRIATQRIEGCQPGTTPPPMCDPMDPNCMIMPAAPCAIDPSGSSSPLSYVGDHFHTATITPRGSATLRIALPLFEHVWLDALVGLSYQAFSHVGSYPAPPDAAAPSDAIAIPGEPTTGVQLAVGLRVGLP